MAINDLRTKITDLPLCEDIDSLETVVGIGTDGKMYRIEKDNVVGGGNGKWEPLTLIKTADDHAELNSNEINTAFEIGGKIHFIVLCNNVYHDFDFIASTSYIPASPSELESDLPASSLGGAFKIIYASSDDDLTLVLKLNYYVNNVVAETFYLESTDDADSASLIGAFFEPIKNISDLSKVSYNAPS